MLTQPVLKRLASALALGLLAGTWSMPAAADQAVAPEAASAPAGSSRELAICSDPANLPYSNERQEGFENRIASLIAKDLHATLHYTWSSQRRSFLRRTLKSGDCDVVMGLPAGMQGVAQTRPYYASSYVFVTRRSSGLQLHGFDDPVLRKLKIGLPVVGAEGANPPPNAALARRGIVDHIVGFPVWLEESDETPQSHLVDAVASGAIDVAILWGPFAGYFAQRHGNKLLITQVDGDPQQPKLPFRFDMSLSVRPADTALLNELQQVLDRRKPEVQAILMEYGIPLVAIHASQAGGGLSDLVATH